MYVYACQKCGRGLEVRQSFQDDPLIECEICGGGLKRVVQPVGIVFKGSGFYKTDYKSDGVKAGTSTGNGHSEGASDGAGASGGAPIESARAAQGTPAKESATAASSATAGTTT